MPSDHHENGVVAEKQNLLEAQHEGQNGKSWTPYISGAGHWMVDTVRPTALKRSSKSQRLRRTAYLDGIRGFAAFLVYIHHHELWAHEPMAQRFQSALGFEREYNFVCWPVVRTFFSGGHLAVACFFIMSGYVLSTKPLQLLQNGDLLAFTDNLASALFRRWFRLFLPIIAVTLFNIVLFHWFGILGIFVPEMSFGKDMWKWYCEFKNYTFLYGNPQPPWLSFHPHTWTIPAEMRGSIVIYCACIALSRCKQNMRLLCECALIYYFMYIVDGAWFSMFMTGMLLSDLDQLQIAKKLPAWYRVDEDLAPTLWHSLLVIGLLIGGVPSSVSSMDYLKKNPGWKWLAYVKPQAVFDFKWFALYFAAVCIVVSVPRLRWLKGFFETRFCQYLGRISYMLYLVHGPILWTVGDRVYAAVGWSRESHGLIIPGWANRFPMPKTGPLGLEISFLIPQLILLPITFWIAEITTNSIDTPAIKFGQWLYGTTQETEEQYP